MYTAAGSVSTFNITRMEALFPNQGQVIFRSVDNPDNARGHTADGIIIDEAPMCKERAYYEVLRPIISDTNGWLLAVGTPKGRNWFWNELRKARDNGSDSMGWVAPTLGIAVQNGQLIRVPHPLENPTFPFDEAVQMFNTMPELTFRQEFSAEFIVRTGLIYSNFDREIHAKERDAREFTHWALAIDEGYTNPTAILLFGIDLDGRLHIAREFYERGKLQAQVIDETLRMSRLYGQAHKVIVDSAAAGLIAGLLNVGLPAQPHKGKVLDGISVVQSLLMVQGDGLPRLTVDPSCAATIAEFESYVWKENKDEPVKANDHAMDAARYLCDWLLGREIVMRQAVYEPVRITSW